MPRHLELDALLVIRIVGKEGLIDETTVTTAEDGRFSGELQDLILHLDDSSLSASVFKGPHRLGTMFLE